MIKHTFNAEVHSQLDGPGKTRKVVITHYDIIDAIQFMRNNMYNVKSISVVGQASADSNIGWIFYN